jgi:hypothetical protein
MALTATHLSDFFGSHIKDRNEWDGIDRGAIVGQGRGIVE